MFWWEQNLEMSDTWQRGCKYFRVVCELRMRVTCLSSANTTQGGYTSSTEKKTIPEKCTSNNNDEKSYLLLHQRKKKKSLYVYLYTWNQFITFATNQRYNLTLEKNNK